VYVKSVGVGTPEKRPLQFLLFRLDKESLDTYVYRKKVIDICMLESSKFGYSVKDPEKSCEECYTIAIMAKVSQESSTEYTPSYTTPVQTNCRNEFGGVSCTSTGGQTYGGQAYKSYYYSKYASFDVLQVNKAKNSMEEVRSVFVSLNSDTGNFTDQTAENLCKGFFAGYAKDLSQWVDVKTPKKLFEQETSASLGFITVDAKEGTIVSRIDPNSTAYQSGIRQGDILKAINYVTLTTTEELREILKRINPTGTAAAKSGGGPQCNTPDIKLQVIAH